MIRNHVASSEGLLVRCEYQRTGYLIIIVFRKRFAVEPGQIPKGQRFKTVICNPGMLCYCIFWIVMILLQMFPEIVQMLLGISPLSL